MSKFEDIKELLANAFDNFSDVLEIEMRSEFSVIDLKDYGGQSFIIINIQFDDNTFTINFNGNETVITDFDSTKLFNISNSIFVVPHNVNKLLTYSVEICNSSSVVFLDIILIGTYSSLLIGGYIL